MSKEQFLVVQCYWVALGRDETPLDWIRLSHMRSEYNDQQTINNVQWAFSSLWHGAANLIKVYYMC